MSNFFSLKFEFFQLPEKNQNFRKFACKTRYSFVKLPEKLKFFGNLPVEIEFFLTRIHDPQISNQIGAAVAILLLISLWHHLDLGATIVCRSDPTWYKSDPKSTSSRRSTCTHNDLRRLGQKQPTFDFQSTSDMALCCLSSF